MISLKYLTPLTYPSKFANRLQVAKMSGAFSKVTDFTLFIRRSDIALKQIYEDSNTADFAVTEIGDVGLWPRSLWYAHKVSKNLNNDSEKVVYYTRDIPLCFWLIIINRKFRRSFFFELHALGRFSKFFYKTVFKNSLGIISTNVYKANDLQKKFNIPKNKIVVFGNGVDTNQFANLPSKEEARKALNISSNEFIVLYAGTFAPDYGSDIIVDTAKQMDNKVKFICIGNSAQKSEVGIEFRGRVSHDQSVLYMRAADVVVAPYSFKNERIRTYSSPIKIKEYMASGTPMVVSDLPVVREAVDESEAYIIKPDNSEKLAATIEHIRKNPEEAKEKSERALVKVKKFDWNRRAKSIIDFMIANI